MKKTMILTVLFLLLGNYLFSQTWTIRDDDGSADYERRVITGEDWNRLLRQAEAQSEYAVLKYVDELELRSAPSLRVIRGTRPTFQGYYYLMETWIPRTDIAREGSSYIRTTLYYGNSRTGRFVIFFLNRHPGVNGVVRVGSDSYNRQKNQYIRWVNGEQ